MIDVVSQFLIEFINALPFLIPLVLVFNLCSSLLFGGKQ